jgi:hypothetical protein
MKKANEEGLEIKHLVRNSNNLVVVENYFSPQEWEAPIVGISSPVIFQHRTLQEYVHSKWLKNS